MPNPTQLPHGEHELFCQEHGGHLVSIHSREENEVMKNAFSKEVFILFQDQIEAEWSFRANGTQHLARDGMASTVE